ncbi:MoaA/NifB/PqqE/SkfB family radical SAM enzyme [Cupriavidus alkaliphilus]|uniref:radical SAM protein n=1 Tax=Cupriavidus alkaliphilus TaxID=942866 RepID=UPI000DE6A3D8|nr:radical SAM protein [Cupriavidus alkaliphilus]PVY69374.1 MoaA/NifB/PqqE/SkfB family radical SAM enzyme [Cupriavidus alkaliphilus]
MEYFKAHVDGEVIYIIRDPRTWMRVNSGHAEQVERMLTSNDPAIARSLKEIAKVPRLPGREHLALYPVVKLTNRCNLTCPHCYLEAPGSMRRGKFDLGYREVKAFIDYIIALGRAMKNSPRTLQLFGGEPTINKDFANILRYARNQGLMVRVSTNAVNSKTFQSEAFSEFYADRGIEWRVSLDSHVREVHDRFRPRSFERVVTNVRYMADRGAFLSIKAVIGSHNVGSFIDTIYFARELGATQFLYSPLSITGAAARMSLLNKVTTRMITEKIVAAIERDAGLGTFLQSSPLARYLKLIYTRDAGILPRVQFHINHDGRVCPQDNLFEYPDTHFGDIAVGDYAFPRLCEYQALLEEPLACKACPVSHYCPRGDYADLAAAGLDSAEEFSVCDDIRDNIVYLMSLGQRGVALAATVFGQPR